MLKNNGFHNRHSPILRAFSPLSLFSGGAPGAWYDPSDLTTLFQDSAGTLPVTAVEQPVGLMLDKSQGLVLGPELVVNGTFNTNLNGWTFGGSTAGYDPTWDAGTVRIVRDGSGDGRLNQSAVFVVGRFYRFTFDVTSTTTGATVFVINGISTAINTTQGTKTYQFFAAGTDLQIRTSGTVTVNLDNFTVKELPGNHAFQSTSASRPVLSARYNLLTKTEQFDDAVWAKAGNALIDQNVTVAPDGTQTADLLYIANGVTSIPLVVQSGPPISNNQLTQYVVSFYAKSKGSFRWLRLTSWNGGAGVWFDTLNGTAGQENNGTFVISKNITPKENGWWLCSFTCVFPSYISSAGIYANVFSADGSTAAITGDGTSGIFIWGASLVPANQSTLPYQRVNTATDYNTVGFLPYLRFDGVDDSLSTNSISFTSTDKMSVFAGVRKIVDPNTYAVLVELSASSFSTNGTFAIFPTTSANPQTGYAVGVRASLQFDKNTTVGYPAPVTSVLAMTSDFAGAPSAQSALRINAASVALQAIAGTNAGTGNYGNYPLYIGRRNNASLPFNGQLYSMIIVGKAVTAGELTNTENFVATKTGVVLA